MSNERHIGMNPSPVVFESINMAQGLELNDLELFMLLCQKMIQGKIKQGKKGIKFENGQKMTYSKAQAMLWELHCYFGGKGCFSYGICGSCSKFRNAGYTSGMSGACGDQEKHAFDSCNQHSESGGGFGL